MAQAKVITDYYSNRKRKKCTITTKRKTPGAGATLPIPDYRDTLFQPDLPCKKQKVDKMFKQTNEEGQSPSPSATCKTRNCRKSSRTKKQPALQKEKNTKGPLDDLFHSAQNLDLESNEKNLITSIETISKSSVSLDQKPNVSDVTSGKTDTKIPLQKTPTKRSAEKAEIPPRRKKPKDVIQLDDLTNSSAVVDGLKLDHSISARKSLQDVFKSNDHKSLFSTSEDQSAICSGTKSTCQPSSKANESIKTSAPKKKDASKNLESKTLSPVELRAKLAQCGKLNELQDVLSKVREQASQRQKTSKKKAESKVSKETEKKTDLVPAYVKYCHLAAPAPPSLTLPFKYRTLEEMFHSMDTVVGMLHNRTESCTFKKLKTAVQEMCRKTFQLRNLGQIKTVYPSSYNVYQQKRGQKISASSSSSDGDYDLMVEANFDENRDAIPELSTDGAMTTMSNAQKGQNMLQKFTPSILIARRTIFHNSLVDIVKSHHKKYLSSLSPPMSVPDTKLTRWHPKFGLDQIPEVEPAPLPQPPHIEKFSTAKDVLEKARTMMNPRVAKALELVHSHKSQTPSTSSESQSRPQTKGSNATKTSNPLNGVSIDLLARIREKEARRTIASMMRSPADEEMIGMLERLPELCRILRGLFLTEKKAALKFDSASQKLLDSYRSALSSVEIDKHIQLMVEVLPEWVKIVQIRKDRYLKIDKKTELRELIVKINQALKEQKAK